MSTWTEFRNSITSNLGIKELTPEQVAAQAGKETAGAIEAALKAKTNPPVQAQVDDSNFSFFKNVPTATKISAPVILIGLAIGAYFIFGKGK